jgi:aerobic carbon-monoxide dehydrogenase small subunit
MSEEIERRTIELTVNGERHRLEVEPRKLLADVLRQDLGLTGLNLGCSHGVCGSCTVLLDGATARSCILFAVQADGAEITTIEGIAPSNEEMHPIQEAFWEQQGLQCGYCTPGMVLRTVELLRENPDPTREEVREGIASNLCRCTGYQFIVDSVIDAAARLREGEPDGHVRPKIGVEEIGTEDDHANPAPAAHP